MSFGFRVTGLSPSFVFLVYLLTSISLNRGGDGENAALRGEIHILSEKPGRPREFRKERNQKHSPKKLVSAKQMRHLA